MGTKYENPGVCRGVHISSFIYVPELAVSGIKIILHWRTGGIHISLLPSLWNQSAETDGEYTQTCVTLSPGGGTPLHYHTCCEEHMEPLRGTLGVVIGEETKSFEVGSKAVVPGM